MMIVAEVKHRSDSTSGNRQPSVGKVAHVMDFNEIVEKHTSLVYNVAYRMMGNHHDAEDVVQDAFVSAYRARDRFRGDAQLTTWLYRVTVNAALMRIRKDKRRKEMTVSDEAAPDVPSSDRSDSPEAAAMNGELGGRIQAAINELPEDMRVVVVLRDVQGLSNQEVAKALDISLSAMKARLHRARVSLRDALSPYVVEQGFHIRTLSGATAAT